MNHTSQHTPDPSEKPGMRRVESPSGLPVWGAAAVWLAAALFLPLWSWWLILLYAALSVGVYVILARKCAPVVTYVPEEVKTGDSALDEKLPEILRVEGVLASVAADVASRKPDVATTLYAIVHTLGQIREDLIRDPSDYGRARKFLIYYLGTSEKLALQYRTLLTGGGEGESVTSALGQMEQTFPLLDSSLKRLLDSLYENDLLDISTDIDVLNAMLAGDGLRSAGDR